MKNDVNIVSISKLLGHSSLKTTSIYTHASDEQLVDAVRMFDFKERGNDDEFRNNEEKVLMYLRVFTGKRPKSDR